MVDRTVRPTISTNACTGFSIVCIISATMSATERCNPLLFGGDAKFTAEMVGHVVIVLETSDVCPFPLNPIKPTVSQYKI